MAIPIAAIETLGETISRSSSTTTTELLQELSATAQQLSEGSFNPISVTCGTSLFLRFLTIQRPPPEMSFAEFRAELVQTAKEFVRGSGRCRTVIAETTADFLTDGSVVLVHGYSESRSLLGAERTRAEEGAGRVVVQALLYAAQDQKKRCRVYVTESRPVRFPPVFHGQR